MFKHFNMLVIDQAHSVAYQLDTMHRAGVHGSCLASGGLFGSCPLPIDPSASLYIST